MMQAFSQLTSRVVPLVVDNIDTDQIIPARFLKVTGKTGLGDVLFCDWRYDGEVSDLEAAAEVTTRSDFPLNHPHHAGAQILLAGDNFGCGSSREHAPWALIGWGFRAIISTSFADIFRSNALKNFLLPVEVNPATQKELVRLTEAKDGLILTIDLPSQIVQLPDGRAIEFPIDAFAKRCLIEGIGQLAYLLEREDHISSYEEARRAPESR
jgi:3-isopropylmalate/(R)-2-methylmalate dehydratase small subunit